jgi:hypothetical protein
MNSCCTSVDCPQGLVCSGSGGVCSAGQDGSSADTFVVDATPTDARTDSSVAPVDAGHDSGTAVSDAGPAGQDTGVVCTSIGPRVAIYRYWSYIGDHMWSTSSTAPVAGYLLDGAAFYLAPTPCAAGLVPLEQLSLGFSHYLVADPTEIARLMAIGWTNTGSLGCVAQSANICGASALEGMIYPEGYIMFTSSTAEITFLLENGWIPQGIPAWVWNTPSI